MIDDSMVSDSDPYQHEIIIDGGLTVTPKESSDKVFSFVHAISILFMLLLGFMTAQTTTSPEEFYKSIILYIAESIIILIIGMFFNSFHISSYLKAVSMFFLGSAASSIIFYVL